MAGETFEAIQDKGKTITDDDDKERKAKHALRAMTAVRAHQRGARLTGDEPMHGTGAAIRELIRGLEHLCERDGLSLIGLIRSALRETHVADRSLAEASDAELTGTIRAVRDAYAPRLAPKDQKLWRMECDELVGWIEEAR